MRILTVCSYNSGSVSPFVREQVNSLREMGVIVDYFRIKGKGTLGYLKNLAPLKNKIKEGNYDLVHAHYGLSGLLANLQFTLPVVTTFHGSDVHFRFNRFLSYITSRLSSLSVLTNKKQVNQLILKRNFKIIACGVDTNLFRPNNKLECRRELGLEDDESLVLFSSAFDNKVKNAELAQQAINKLKNVSLLELKGFSREEVALLINASDAVLVTSFYETGPLIVKEALACNTPVISTDVGDVKDLIEDLDNCYITSYDPTDIANKVKLVLKKESKCKGRSAVQEFSLPSVAKSVKDVYKEVLKRGYH